MEKIRLGQTNMMVSKLGLGGVPIQRVTDDEAELIIRRCLDLGITFLDTAAEYSNSEGRFGKAIRGRREGLIISTKSNYGTQEEVGGNIRQSLKQLGITSIDLFQFHGVNNFDVYGQAIDPQGAMAVIQEAKRAGLIKHSGITTHSMDVAKEAVKSGLFETIMFPFNFVTCEPADELLPLAREHDVGFIAMKPFAGGLIKNVTLAFKYLFQFPDVVFIPGIKEEHEIDEIVQVLPEPCQLTDEEQKEMQRLREQLDKELCRRCGYCEPCPQGVPVLQLVDFLPYLINMPPQTVFSDPIAERIGKVADCDKCGECEKKCPYGLPVMELIEKHANRYQAERRKYQEQQVSR